MSSVLLLTFVPLGAESSRPSSDTSGVGCRRSMLSLLNISRQANALEKYDFCPERKCGILCDTTTLTRRSVFIGKPKRGQFGLRESVQK